MADVKARQRAKRIVQERGLASLANDTKWREFFSLLSGVRVPLEFKFLYGDQPHRNGAVWSPAENYIEGSGMGPELLVFIEWVRSSAAEPVQAAAVLVGLEFELHDGTVTVYGYR